ncbi:hypothetical protein ElyMa_005988900 [Elysia marginata]|uniref:Zasp-like motif domain-containing protein n=1 Tax=Elysia marginata TaxID=1093978 RepID=A0AAV4GHD4_9GAST|nr:hypothetical protein ElyMa_005988900 [Elysia marginata]
MATRPSLHNLKTSEATTGSRCETQNQGRQDKHKFYNDRSTRQHRTFHPNNNATEPVQPIKRQGHIYEVVTEDGTMLRRNQRFTNPSYEPTTVIPADVMEDSTTTTQMQNITFSGYGDNKSSSPAVEPTISPP